MQNIVQSLLTNESIISLLNKSEKKKIFSQLNLTFDSDLSGLEQCRLAFFLVNYVFSNEQNTSSEILGKTYKIFKSININTLENLQYFTEIFGIDGIDSETLYYFYLANISLKIEKLISIRIDLNLYNPRELCSDWKYRLLNKSLEAYILLVRKQNGFTDVERALSIIELLKHEQQNYEERYLNQFVTSDQVEEAYILLAIYHLSKAIVETASYLLKGYDYRGERLDATIRHHIDVAKKLTKNEPRLTSIFELFEFGLKVIHNNSIWKNTGFNDKIKQLCKAKAELGMLELLPSQKRALENNLLNVVSNVTVLQMPTSSGKTLLAEFNIIFTKALKSDAKIVYIVPSRALVNQIYYDLKKDLEPLNFTIEKTSSAIEIDPTEDSFLSGDENIDILVSTPEKLDLLIRRKHPSVDDISLFILDEAHTIQNGERGAKLELLMAILRREKPKAKYMLLSPFIKNAGNTLAEWLGGGNSITIDWKPSEKLLLGIDVKKTKQGRNVNVEVLQSPYETITPIENTTFQCQFPVESSGRKEQILEYSIKQFSETEKAFLVLCYGKGTTNDRANFIYEKTLNSKPSDDIILVKKFIEDEVGRETTLSKVITKGIVTHHSGMSDEAKILVEHLIREKQIHYVCATTTIAEGVNFPVSSVFFDDYRKGQNNRLSTNDFWNITGRAGRTLIDNYGKIILPFNSEENKQHARRLIKDSANELVSVLSELFENADRIEQALSTESGIFRLADSYTNSLSPLIQYFVHILTVGENDYFVTEIEDLFKDSLQYYLLNTKEKKQKFISICKSIYLHIKKNFQNKGILSFADKTGFSVPSVLKVMSEATKKQSIKNIDGWSKESIFNSCNPSNLAEKISIIAALRETELGTESKEAPFNSNIYAKMIIDWVKGRNMITISSHHPYYNKATNDKGVEKQIVEFLSKMNDIRFKTSWGLSALEGIIRGNEKEIKDSYIPSLVYYGVDNEKSLALRMIGIPRRLSASMHRILEKDLNKYSFKSLRNKVLNLSNSDWDDLKPKNSLLNGQEWKMITEILVK